MSGVIETIQKEWAVIRGAPWSFAIVASVMAAVAYFFSWTTHEGAISQKNATIETLKTQNDAYKEKLRGASPDEAGDRIQIPEKKIGQLSHPSADDIAKASEPVQAKLDGVMSERDAAISERDAAREHLRQNDAASLTPQGNAGPKYLTNVTFTLQPPSTAAETGVVALEADPTQTLSKIRIFVEQEVYFNTSLAFLSVGSWTNNRIRTSIAEISNIVKGVHIKIPFIYGSERGMFKNVLSYGSASSSALLPGAAILNDTTIYPISIILTIIGDNLPDEQTMSFFMILNPSGGKNKFLFVDNKRIN